LANGVTLPDGGEQIPPVDIGAGRQSKATLDNLYEFHLQDKGGTSRILACDEVLEDALKGGHLRDEADAWKVLRNSDEWDHTNPTINPTPKPPPSAPVYPQRIVLEIASLPPVPLTLFEPPQPR
jgi:hypothetical protein